MGLSLEFYIGDRKKINNAFRSLQFDLIYDDSEMVGRIADLSLHLQPRDLNMLSREFGRHSGQKLLDLRSNLKVLVDEPDYGLLLVSKKWIEYAANVPEDALGKIVTSWFQTMKKEYPNEKIEETEEARLAVKELLGLCREAKQKKLEVLHAWFL
ncbi:MAG: hypothetical protein KC434_18620 [Anaerolineales bacterium]|nr:hypothetical protein [Anaerolineales bacterium]